MNFDIVLLILLISIIMSLIGLILIIITFKNYYSGMGLTIISSYLMFLIYNILEIIIVISEKGSNQLLISRLSSSILGIGLYLLHYFHDEISADYRQRKTMTIGSLLLGLAVGGAWIEGSIKISQDLNAPIVHPIYGLVLVAQSLLLVHRVTNHHIIMGELSDYYGIEGKLKNKYRWLIQKVLYIFLTLSSLAYLVLDEIISTPFALMVSTASILLALLYKQDPLTSLPIAQPLQAVALIRDKKVLFLYILASSGESVAKQDDFGNLMVTLSQFFSEIMKSKSRIRYISTPDVLVMFEKCGMDHLVLVLKQRVPLLRKILKSTSKVIVAINPQTDREFSEIILKNLLFR